MTTHVNPHKLNKMKNYNKQSVKKGSNHGRAKLDEEKVQEIRELYKTGFYKQKDLAIEFGVNQRTISNIITKTNWNHVNETK
jgi:DNA invertase Pin-like site-specific DNA recombinase